MSRQVTVAPATGLRITSSTWPTTVVPGSGITVTVTSSAMPMFPPRSNARAPRVSCGPEGYREVRLIRRGGVGEGDRAVDQELDQRDTDVVAGGHGDGQ
jgi:hypothetical protein